MAGLAADDDLYKEIQDLRALLKSKEEAFAQRQRDKVTKVDSLEVLQ